MRANGANTLTIAGGHAIDALCAVLGEFAEVSARVSTRIPEWHTLDGKPVPVDAPDSINVVGRTGGRRRGDRSTWPPFPRIPAATESEIYGREGALVIQADGSLNIGPSQLHAGKGKEPMVSMPVPSSTSSLRRARRAACRYNVAQAYARMADARRAGRSFDVDFNLAVQRHKLIDAIERSSATGRSVRLELSPAGGRRSPGPLPRCGRRAAASPRRGGGSRDARQNGKSMGTDAASASLR